MGCVEAELSWEAQTPEPGFAGLSLAGWPLLISGCAAAAGAAFPFMPLLCHSFLFSCAGACTALAVLESWFS